MIKTIERTKDGVDSLIDRTSGAVVGVADRAETGVEAVAERVVEKAHAAGEYVRAGAATASRDAHERLETAAQAVDRGYVKAQGDLTRAAAKTTEYVHENPGKSLLLAASAGFVLGLAVTLRRSTPTD
jgi:hypothetical protein